MKITQKYLQKLIKEEINRLLGEQLYHGEETNTGAGPRDSFEHAGDEFTAQVRAYIQNTGVDPSWEAMAQSSTIMQDAHDAGLRPGTQEYSDFLSDRIPRMMAMAAQERGELGRPLNIPGTDRSPID
jgi:hypothetical protein